MEKEVINLHKLENLPDIAFYNIIEHLEPKSLVKVCSASKAIKRRCKEAWKQLYKRDISKQTFCKKPNWEKLYRLAMTEHIRIYAISLYKDWEAQAQNFPETERLAIGEKKLKEAFEDVLKEDLEWDKDERERFLKKHTIKGNEDYDVDGQIILIESVGQIPIRDILKIDSDKDQPLYEMMIESGHRTQSLFGIGLEGILENAEKTLEKWGLDEDAIEEFIDDIRVFHIHTSMEDRTEIWNEALDEASFGGHLDIVKYLESKRADDWNEQEHVQGRIQEVETLDEDDIKDLKESICKMK